MSRMSPQEQSDSRRQLMLNGKLMRVIPLMAMPQVVTMLIDSLYNMADTYFVSQLGLAATAAVGVNDSLMTIIRALSFMFAMGAASYISRLLGAKEDVEASRAASTTLFTSVFFMALIAVASSFFLSPLVMLLGATESARAPAMEYAQWTLIFCPVTAASICLSQSLRGEGSTMLAMIGSVAGCVVNVALDPLFITTFGLGVAGAAIATGISKVISFAVLLYPFVTRKTILRISPRLFTPHRRLYGEIARMGIPTGLRTGMLSVGIIIMNNVAGGYGDIALAAVSVANKCMKLVASAVMGFGQGFQPIGGYCWGAKKYGRLKEAFLLTTLIGAAISVVLGVALGIFAAQAVGLFSDDAEMLDIGVKLVRSQCAVLPLHTFVMIAGSLFQGAGKAIPAGVLGFARQVLALIPCILVMSYFFGLGGLIYSQAAADVISFLMSLCFVIPMFRLLDRLKAEQEGETLGEGAL